MGVETGRATLKEAGQPAETRTHYSVETGLVHSGQIAVFSRGAFSFVPELVTVGHHTSEGDHSRQPFDYHLKHQHKTKDQQIRRRQMRRPIPVERKK